MAINLKTLICHDFISFYKFLILLYILIRIAVKMTVGLFYCRSCNGAHMAGLATAKRGIFSAFFLMAAVTGNIRAAIMISHESAHYIPLSAAF